MSLLLSYALVLSNSVNLAVVDVYPTLQNCDVMVSRVRSAISDQAILVSCWPTTHRDVDQVQQQLHDVITILAGL
jgi:Holliday junction resolvase RusA-like endonuclease